MRIIRPNKVKQILKDLMDKIEINGDIDRTALERFDRSIKWCKRIGYDVHPYETVSRCYHQFLNFDYKSFGVSCGDSDGETEI